jgi:uncharacterized protein
VDGAPRPNAIELLVLQGTSFCNIDCSYCYLTGRLDKRRMSQTSLSAVLAKVFGSRFVSRRAHRLLARRRAAGLAAFVLRQGDGHGGRPCTPGLSVTHNIQTNGLLLDEAWCRFIAERGVRLGLSLDGPALLHDAARRTRSGAGTHARVMRPVALLRSEGVPFHVITVLRRESLAHADALFDFYLAHGIREVAFNIEEIDGEARASSLADAAAEDEFRAFLARFLARMREAPGAIVLREQAWASAAIAAGLPTRLQPGGRSVSDPLRHASRQGVLVLARSSLGRRAPLIRISS